MGTNLRKHVLKYSIFIIISKSILFVAGIFIQNQTMPMAFLTLLYLSIFCFVCAVTIKKFKRSIKLKIIEKSLVIITLFLIHEIWGVLLHFVYFVGVMGQRPKTLELFSKIIEIVKFDAHILVIAVVVSGFINSKIVEGVELSK